MKPARPPQLHRSLSFWAGILMMGFIAWGWWDSRNHVSSAAWQYFSLNHGGGGVITGWRAERLNTPSFRREEKFVRAEVLSFFADGSELLGFRILGGGTDNDRTPWPGPLLRQSPGRLDIFIPHWLMLVVVVVMWVGLLEWRSRRRKRQRQVIDEPREGR